MITNKIVIGAGAIALAVTASLTPLVAQAEPSGDTRGHHGFAAKGG